MILLAHQRGFQVAVHAVGDKAVKVTINSFVQAIQRYPGEPTALCAARLNGRSARFRDGGKIRHSAFRTLTRRPGI